jgi:CO dehydrogenase nickel-insertion accessory protein CooC1
LSIEELFRYTWALDADYFFTIDSALMIASKGGFNINILNTMGIKTKMKYFNSLREILDKMYSNKSSDNTDEMMQ